MQLHRRLEDLLDPRFPDAVAEILVEFWILTKLLIVVRAFGKFLGERDLSSLWE